MTFLLRAGIGLLSIPTHSLISMPGITQQAKYRTIIQNVEACNIYGASCNGHQREMSLVLPVIYCTSNIRPRRE